MVTKWTKGKWTRAIFKWRARRTPLRSVIFQEREKEREEMGESEHEGKKWQKAQNGNASSETNKATIIQLARMCRSCKLYKRCKASEIRYTLIWSEVTFQMVYQSNKINYTSTTHPHSPTLTHTYFATETHTKIHYRYHFRHCNFTWKYRGWNRKSRLFSYYYKEYTETQPPTIHRTCVHRHTDTHTPCIA